MVDKLIAGTLVGLCLIGAALVAWLGVLIYDHATSEKIELVKSNWDCTKSEARPGIIMAGKVPVPTATNVCVEYKRL